MDQTSTRGEDETPFFFLKTAAQFSILIKIKASNQPSKPANTYNNTYN